MSDPINALFIMAELVIWCSAIIDEWFVIFYYLVCFYSLIIACISLYGAYKLVIWIIRKLICKVSNGH